MSYEPSIRTPASVQERPALRGFFDPDRWALVWRRSLFLLSALPLAVFVPTMVIWLVSLGAGLSIMGVGLLILLVAAALSRWFGGLELRRLAWAGAPPIEPPQWPVASGRGLIGRIALVLLDGRQWSYIAYSVLYLFLGTVTGSLGLVWLFTILGGATRWLWGDWIPMNRADMSVIAMIVPAARFVPPFLHGPVVSLAYAILGAIGLVTLPWLTAALVGLHDRLARVFLGRYGPEEIDAQMAGLRRSRQAGLAAEGRALRKLERDLHDGPQQQLLRLQIDLAAAQRKIATDPETASRLIEDAGRRSAETLAELRLLVRGMVPPILQDRGLVAALEALAERNAIPATVLAQVQPGLNIEPAVQQGVYFVVAELLANSVKHSGARRVTIECWTDPDAKKLTVAISDDGQGGAKMLPGHGLTGIAERIEGLGGAWSLVSPLGGPTRITLHVPT